MSVSRHVLCRFMLSFTGLYVFSCVWFSLSVAFAVYVEQVDVLVSQTLAALGPDADGNVSQENFVKVHLHVCV